MQKFLLHAAGCLRIGNRPKLLARFLSLASRKNPDCDWWRGLKCVSIKCAAWVAPPLNFFHRTMKYYVGKGENSWFKMPLEFLSCVQAAFPSASYDRLTLVRSAFNMSSYDNIILKTQYVICLESLYLKKDSLGVLPTGYGKTCRFARAKSAFREFAYSTRSVHERKR